MGKFPNIGRMYNRCWATVKRAHAKWKEESGKRTDRGKNMDFGVS